MRDIIEIVKEHWLIIIGSFFVVRLVELILRRILRSLFGVAILPLRVLKKGSLKDYIFIGVILALIGGYVYILM